MFNTYVTITFHPKYMWMTTVQFKILYFRRNSTHSKFREFCSSCLPILCLREWLNNFISAMAFGRIHQCFKVTFISLFSPLLLSPPRPSHAIHGKCIVYRSWIDTGILPQHSDLSSPHGRHHTF